MTTVGPGILKFIAVGFYALIIITILAGIVSGIITYKKTGDKTQIIESTLGEVVTWDTNIHVIMQQLMNEEFLNGIPEEIRSEYVSTTAKGIFVYLFLLVLLGFIIFKIGNWIVGLSQFSPITDIVIIGIALLLIFVFIPLLYGYTMDKEVTLVRGVTTWLRNLDVWWNALGGVSIVDVPSTTNEVISASTIIVGG